MSERVSGDSLQPILVVLVWRGGARFERALESLRQAEKYFKRVVLSITSEPDSADMKAAEQYLRMCELEGRPSKAEVICTQVELPTMEHQAYWINYLLNTGADVQDWIFWLAYDDQLRLNGLQAIAPDPNLWPLKKNHAYFGPWGIRHELPDKLWEPSSDAILETWTSFPSHGPTTMSPLNWALDQLVQPTYMQMSGSVCSLESHARLVQGFPRKSGPMRIELATALDPSTEWVKEFVASPTYIYGRSNSDRSNYSRVARREDRDLIFRLLKNCVHHPRGLLDLLGHRTWRLLSQMVRGINPEEEWRVRETSRD